MKKLQIAIIGSAGPEEYLKKNKPSQKIYQIAFQVGKLLAKKGIILVTGGKGGIMKAASQGAKKNGGITVGIISGNKRGKSNEFIDVEVVSGFVNCAEEAIIVSMTDGLIAIGGGSGTLQEIATAYRNRKPMVAFDNLPGWGEKLANSYLDQRKKTKITKVKNPEEAVNVLLKKIKMLSSKKEKI